MGGTVRTLIAVFALLVNVASFAAFGIDKGRARRGAWRVPERMLMLLAAAGGGAGALAGMHAFRHKTRKPLFRIGVPLLAAVQVALAASLALQP